MVDVRGKQLGRYELHERIGKGGMASVYKGWDTTLERWVALKVLHDYLAEEKDFKLRFEREAKLIASLNHPNIVQVYDFGAVEREDSTLYYMVMAYVEGASLRRLMERKHELGERMTLFEIQNVLRGVCNALAYAHQRGMVHRDVTPGNILFNEEGQVVLADFGIARMISGTRLTQTGTTSGTPMYMSPEQGVGEPGDHRSDIYSVGVILFEMLTGHPPYEGDSTFAILLKHVNDPIPSPLAENPALPPPVEAIIFRALDKDPDSRYQSIEELLTDFERVAMHEAQTTRMPLRTRALPVQAAKRARLGRWLPLAGGIGLVALAAFVVMLVLGARPSEDAETDSARVTLAVPPIKTRNFAPSMTSGPLIFTDDFGPDRGQKIWPITTDDPQIYRNIENGVYRIRHTLPATALTSIFDEYHQYGTNFVYQADFTLSEQGQQDNATGIVFRYRNDDQYYVFAVNAQGQVSLWLRYRGVWTELRNLPTNWTPAEGVNPAGQTNRLKLIDYGKRLMGYINGNLVIEVESEPVLLSGAIGIYLATTQSLRVPNPMAEVVVDNFSVETYRQPTPAASGS